VEKIISWLKVNQNSRFRKRLVLEQKNGLRILAFVKDAITKISAVKSAIMGKREKANSSKQ